MVWTPSLRLRLTLPLLARTNLMQLARTRTYFLSRGSLRFSFRLCNRFFSSYNRAASGWNYIMGNFAQMSLPLKDSVTLFVQRVNSTVPEFVTVCSNVESTGVEELTMLL